MSELETSELEVLSQGKSANPYWFNSLIRAASIMAPRRAKYSGDQHASPYTNFILVAFLTGESVQRVLDFYVCIKQARRMVDAGDFADEHTEDTMGDRVNYAMLSHGWMLMSEKERREHCLQVLRSRMPEAFG